MMGDGHKNTSPVTINCIMSFCSVRGLWTYGGTNVNGMAGPYHTGERKWQQKREVLW